MMANRSSGDGWRLEVGKGNGRPQVEGIEVEKAVH